MINTETRRSALWAGWLLVAGSIVSWIGAFSPLVLIPREEFASHEALRRRDDTPLNRPSG